MEQADPGPCRGYFQRWAFVPQKLMCVPFGYGGCRGNRNNFLTAEECNNTCRIVSIFISLLCIILNKVKSSFNSRYETFLAGSP